MTILRDGVRVTLSGLLTLSILGAFGFWTAHSFVNGNVLSPAIWLGWLAVSVAFLIGSIRWQLGSLMSLSNRPVWPMVLALVAGAASAVLLIVSLARQGAHP